jgi:hypothetical protein
MRGPISDAAAPKLLKTLMPVQSQHCTLTAVPPLRCELCDGDIAVGLRATETWTRPRSRDTSFFNYRSDAVGHSYTHYKFGPL